MEKRLRFTQCVKKGVTEGLILWEKDGGNDSGISEGMRKEYRQEEGSMSQRENE